MRGETAQLSEGERNEILQSRISYYPNDLAVIGWNAAFLYDSEAGAETAIQLLEYANSQLLEFRHYDELLTRELGIVYAALDKGTGMLARWRLARAATKLHTVLLDVNELTERADNAIKFLSDMFSARLYKLAAAKVGVPDYKDLVNQKAAYRRGPLPLHGGPVQPEPRLRARTHGGHHPGHRTGLPVRRQAVNVGTSVLARAGAIHHLPSSRITDARAGRPRPHYLRRPMRGLKDKRVLITGGASGIGAATAARFLEEGAAVVVLDRDAKGRAQIQSQLPKLAGTVDADVSNLKQVQAAFAEAVRLMGGVDVLINNAGISIRHNFLDITPEEWDKTIAVNLTGVFYMAQTAARHMWERGSGVILQTASTNGVMGYPFYADYNATKAGVIELTKSMALELAPKVRVCAVAPGYVLTPMQRAEYTDEMLDAVNRKIPLGRHAKPEEIAALFAYLASDDAAFVTGHVYTMDGAETAGGLASR